MWESFAGAQDERTGFEIIEDFPFLLRLSKDSQVFFSKPASEVVFLLGILLAPLSIIDR
jgi:hypothetical protein